MTDRRTIIAALTLSIALIGSANAQTKLRVGKAIQNSFTFALLDVGIGSGVFAKNGLAIEPTVFTGATRLQQALTSNDLDLGLSTGQDLGYIAKGEPVMTVAAITNLPSESVILVNADSPIRTPVELKGKHLAVSNIRGYPSWLGIEFSKHEGWGPDGITLVASGSQPASMALLKTKQVDGWIGDIGTGLQMEDSHEGRILVSLAEVVPPFMNSALYSTNDLIAKHPDQVRAFIKAWLENIAWATAHRKETVALLVPALNLKPEIVDKVYERLMPAESTTGKFEPKAMATMPQAIVDLGILDTKPDISKLYTEAYLPGK